MIQFGDMDETQTDTATETNSTTVSSRELLVSFFVSARYTVEQI